VTAIFITATGTDVGKTFVATTLVRYLRQAGHRIEAVKPIVSGYDPAQAATSDPGLLLGALGAPITPEQIARISPWRFRAPLSPDLAAEREDRSIDVDQVVAFCQERIERHRGILLIEGVGGVMVPLDEHRTILDVMMAVRLPLILVTGSYLGTISHTLTALDSLFRRDMNVLVTVVSETPGSTVPLDDVVAAIGRFTDPVLALPRLQTQQQGSAAAAEPILSRIFNPRGRRPQPEPNR
jgi:dethiobiotin synthetase